MSTMRKLSVAIFTLCLMSDIASARNFNASEAQSIEALTSAFVAGTMCQSFHMMDHAMEDELRAAGMSRDDVQSTEYNTIAEASFNAAKVKYASNPSAYCDETWRLFGSSGTYQRQLLELK
jgi:hypothetical protein